VGTDGRDAEEEWMFHLNQTEDYEGATFLTDACTVGSMGGKL
jgi:hypothetical protein